MMFKELVFNRQRYFFLRTPQPPIRTKRSKVLKTDFAVNHIIYDCCTSLTSHIVKDTGQFQVGILKYTYKTIVLGRKVLDELAAIADHIALVTLGLFRNTTTFQRSYSQQLAYPCGVFLVCFMTWNIFNITGIYYQDCKTTWLQYVNHRFPINTGTLHSHMGYT